MSDEVDSDAAPSPKPGTAAARRSSPRTKSLSASSRSAPSPAGAASGARRKPVPAPASSTDVAADEPPASRRVRRDESTEFLLQSLRDLESERAAGDLDDDDYRALRDDYTARAAKALKAEQRGKTPPTPDKRRRSPLQWGLIVAGVVGFAVLAGVLMAQASGERGTGEGITGEIIDSPTQAASRCIQMSASATADPDATQATLECYRAVLEDDPDNAVARTYLGWTLYTTAQRLAASLGPDALADLYLEAGRQLDLAVEADPAYADARAFQVVLAVNEGSYELAVEHLEVFDSLDVPADMANLIDSMRSRIDAGLAGETVPEEPEAPSGDGAGTSVPATSVPG